MPASSAWREPTPEPPARMVDVRCRNCKRLLYRIDAERARVETVCPDKRCHRYSVKTLTPTER